QAVAVQRLLRGGLDPRRLPVRDLHGARQGFAEPAAGAALPRLYLCLPRLAVLHPAVHVLLHGAGLQRLALEAAPDGLSDPAAAVSLAGDPHPPHRGLYGRNLARWPGGGTARRGRGRAGLWDEPLAAVPFRYLAAPDPH